MDKIRKKKRKETVIRQNEGFIVVRKHHHKLKASTKDENRKALSDAIRVGDVDLVRKLHQDYAIPFASRDIYVAAREGHLECMRYLHQNGCALDDWSIAATAAGGHLPCLQYAIENGCPYRMDRCMIFAELALATDCIEYLNTLQ